MSRQLILTEIFFLPVLSMDFPGAMELESYDAISPTCSKSNREKAYREKMIHLSVGVSYPYDNLTDFEIPSAMWFKDGYSVSFQSMEEILDDGFLSSSLSFSFKRSDSGVYQCIFAMDNTSVLLGSPATRIDYGKECHFNKKVKEFC